ncbi:MAG TPA: hypothetical protein VG900_15240 [Hyphomicrobiaceae bacterium]|jgi:hypothetical protein|nr:hypothetical protein [Hyphomicrobiaceae bacterium]
MQTSYFLARLLGPLLLVLGASMAFNAKVYTDMANEFIASRALVYLAGAAALTAGLSIVLSHNVWTADWRLIITLLGWIATLAGISRLLFPDMVRSVGRGMFTSEKPVFITGIVWAVLGAILCFAGYLS